MHNFARPRCSLLPPSTWGGHGNSDKVDYSPPLEILQRGGRRGMPMPCNNSQRNRRIRAATPPPAGGGYQAQERHFAESNLLIIISLLVLNRAICWLSFHDETKRDEDDLQHNAAIETEFGGKLCRGQSNWFSISKFHVRSEIDQPLHIFTVLC